MTRKITIVAQKEFTSAQIKRQTAKARNKTLPEAFEATRQYPALLQLGEARGPNGWWRRLYLLRHTGPHHEGRNT